MSNPASQASALRSLTPVLVSGADARQYLQGQLSCDVRKLSPERALLASFNSGQGRVQAILTVLERPEGVFAVLPTSIVEATVARLRRFVLRGDIQIEVCQNWTFSALPSAALTQSGFDSSQLAALSPGQTRHRDQRTLLRWWSVEPRYLLLTPSGAHAARTRDDELADAAWHRADIAAGLPTIYPETRDSYVPQMLNLDRLEGIDYDKGCYVGQEIVARARRAHVKRRLQRYAIASGVGTAPALTTPILHDGVQVGEVIDATNFAGHSEVLAVVDNEHCTTTLYLGTPTQPALTALPLPYETTRAQP
jgi:folate-binding protein YgfZ